MKLCEDKLAVLSIAAGQGDGAVDDEEDVVGGVALLKDNRVGVDLAQATEAEEASALFGTERFNEGILSEN